MGASKIDRPCFKIDPNNKDFREVKECSRSHEWHRCEQGGLYTEATLPPIQIEATLFESDGIIIYKQVRFIREGITQKRMADIAKSERTILQKRIKEQRRELKLKNQQVSELKELVCKLSKLKDDYNQFRIDRIPLIAQLEQTTADCEKAIEAYRHFKGENDKLREKVHELHVSGSVAKAKLDEIEKYLNAEWMSYDPCKDAHKNGFRKELLNKFFPKPSPKIKVGDRVEILVDHKCGWIFRGNKGKVVRIDGNLEMPLVIRFDDGMVMADYAHIRKVE